MVFSSIQSFCRAGAFGVLLATLSACASVNAQPPNLAEAYKTCFTQARVGVRGPSSHATSMAAACDALAAQAGRSVSAQTVADVAATCRTAAGQGHPPGTSPYKRQFRDMHKNRSRAVCDDLAAAVMTGNGGGQP
jgi:hypothetical protein